MEEIPDKEWEEIKRRIPGEQGKWGRVATDNKDFINTVLGLLEQREPFSEQLNWKSIGDKSATYNRRFTNWRKNGVWEDILPYLLHKNAWLVENRSYELLLTNYKLLVFIEKVNDKVFKENKYPVLPKVFRNRERSRKALQSGKIKKLRGPYKPYYSDEFKRLLDEGLF